MAKYISFPLDNTYYTAEAEQLYNSNRTNGVFGKEKEFLTTFVSGMTVRVNPGRAWLHLSDMKGFVFGSFEPVDLKLQIGDTSLNRIDRIVIRYDIVRNTSSLVVLQGELNSRPTPPAITRNTTTYFELCIAEIRVNAGVIELGQEMISDKRLDESLCGVVKDGIESIPTQSLISQWETWFNKLIYKGENDWENWYNSNTKLFGNQFNNWFQNLKNQLDSNQASNLQNQINKLNDNVNDFRKITGNKEIIIKNSKEGYLNEILIKGKTIGGYSKTKENFMELKSTGEDEKNTIILSTTGVNLNSSSLEQGWFTTEGLPTPNSGRQRSKDFVKLKPDTVYTKSDVEWWFWEYDKNRKFLKVTSTEVNTFRTNAQTKFVKFSKATPLTQNSRLQIVEGSELKEYQPYKNDTKSIKIPFEKGLKSIPNTTEDILNLGKGEIIQNIGSREYEVGDEDKEGVITDKKNTYYKLDFPIIHKIKFEFLKCYKDITYIIQDNSIVGDFEIGYDTTRKTLEIFSNSIESSKGENIEYKGIPLGNYIYKNLLSGNFVTGTGKKYGSLAIPHNLGNTPFFFATVQSVNFVSEISTKREVALPVTYRFDNETDYANITISADTNNFYLELSRNQNLANNDWFKNIKYSIRYTD